jgi:hypothetical protein
MDVMRAAPLLLAPMVAASAASAQIGTPVGPASLVNSYTTDDQVLPSVAVDATGAFVVVWQSSGQDGAGWGIFGQRHDAAGDATGAEFRVNTATASHQAYPRVASSPAGEFLVVWDSFGQDGSSFGVFGQRYDAAGEASGAEFQVNTHTLQSQSNPAAAWSAGGSSVAVWHSENQDGHVFGVFGQRYDAGGAPAGDEFQVNEYTPNDQSYPAVAAGRDGAFAVVWEDSARDGSGRGVFGRVFNATGTPVGGDFRVNTFTAGNQGAPAVAWTGPSGFVVVWHGGGQDGSGLGVFGQRFDATGTVSGSEFAVNSSTLGGQGLPAVAADPTGAFVVVWVSGGYEGSGAGLFGQRYDPQGSPDGLEFVVNAYTTGAPLFPVVASSRTGFVVAWQSAEQDGGGKGVLAQRYRGDLIFADGFE